MRRGHFDHAPSGIPQWLIKWSRAAVQSSGTRFSDPPPVRHTE
jgi:hypothetical protein